MRLSRLPKFTLLGWPQYSYVENPVTVSKNVQSRVNKISSLPGVLYMGLQTISVLKSVMFVFFLALPSYIITPKFFGALLL